MKDINLEENQNIKICPIIFETMGRYIQSGFSTLEAGGILIGKENISDNGIVIKYITSPCENDKRKYNEFIRKDKQHIEFFNEIYKESNGTYRYVGEWHTHDEDIPKYSLKDLKGWKKIVKQGPKNINYFHIIAGRKAINVWKISKLFKTPLLVKTIYYEGETK